MRNGLDIHQRRIATDDVLSGSPSTWCCMNSYVGQQHRFSTYLMPYFFARRNSAIASRGYTDFDTTGSVNADTSPGERLVVGSS